MFCSSRMSSPGRSPNRAHIRCRAGTHGAGLVGARAAQGPYDVARRAKLWLGPTQAGASGLGLEAQRKAVADYLNGGKWTLAAEFVEVESGKRANVKIFPQQSLIFALVCSTGPLNRPAGTRWAQFQRWKRRRRSMARRTRRRYRGSADFRGGRGPRRPTAYGHARPSVQTCGGWRGTAP
jgi:hypothetical protein